jgi:hypothetical protein
MLVKANFSGIRKSHTEPSSGEYGGWGMTRVMFWPKNYEQATTKFSSFGMNFDATRFIPETFRKF